MLSIVRWFCLNSFRINPLAAEKKNEADRNMAAAAQKRKLRTRVSDSDTSDSDVAVKKKERPTRSPASSRLAKYFQYCFEKTKKKSNTFWYELLWKGFF